MSKRKSTRLPVPDARRTDVVDDYHGTQVADPYRWLEEPDNPETIAWTEAENARTHAFLDALPGRKAIEQRLTSLWNFPVINTVHKAGERLFFTRNSGLQNQPVLYVRDEKDGKETLLLDPNTLSEDGTVALISQHYSMDGRYLAFSLSGSGSDWQEIHVLDTLTGEETGDHLLWTKFANIAWQADSSGFYYNRLPNPENVSPEDQDTYSRIYFHRLGTPQNDDVLVYEFPEDKELAFSPFSSDDGKYLLINSHRGTDRRNGLVFRKMEADVHAPFTSLVPPEKARYIYLGNSDDSFYFLSTEDAPNGKIVMVNLEDSTNRTWKLIIPEGENAIEMAGMVADRLVLILSHHAYHRLQVYSLDGKFINEPDLPAMGSLSLLDGGSTSKDAFLGFSSFLHPPSIYRYEATTDKLIPFFVPEIPFDMQAYETRQVFYPSADGTRVPMFLTHRKGIRKDRSNPVILYGYGGFTISQPPYFNVWNLVWLEMGGTFALANLRGGTEYGEAWHRAGMLGNKQNVFDDFIAAGEWLIKEGYTSPAKLAIEGRSNGGLLVAACMLQRPDLFGAVLCHVPVTDMLRYHKFTVGRFWVPEYGNAELNPEHFRFLYAYSPLHNVQQGVHYPPIIVTTGDTDDRVVPSHSKKFVAELQAKADSDSLVLLRVESKAGHKLGKPTYKIIAERADVWAFVAYALGMRVNFGND